MKKGYVLVLGAKSDIAEAIAYKFAQQGYNIYLAARNCELLIPTAKDLEIKHNILTEVIEFDALNYSTHSDFYHQLNQKPSIVVSVFGILGQQSEAEINFEHAHRIIDSNFTGQVSILNIVANDFEKSKQGTIIGISSVAGERGRKSNYIYGASKAAFSTYLDGMRHRLYGSNVHVMTVKPGFVRTQMTAGLPLPKPVTAEPAQVANYIYNGFLKKKNTIYTFPIWRWIMLLIKNIPDFIFHKTNL